MVLAGGRALSSVAVARAGRGQFGRVVQATVYGSDVAVKIISEVQDVAALKLFRHEVAMLRNANHPNIVQLLGVCKVR